MRIHGVALVVVLALGCGSGTKPDTVGNDTPPTPDAAPADELPADLVEVVEREIAVLERIAAAAASGGSDCDAVSANLHTVAEGPDGTAMGEAGTHPGYTTYQKEIEARYLPRIDAAVSQLLAAVEPCADHPGVQDVMGRLGF